MGKVAMRSSAFTTAPDPRSATQFLKPEATKRILLMPDAAAKIIIGKGGERINEICRMSGSNIQVRRGYPTSEFTLRGKYDAAYHLICQILASESYPLDAIQFQRAM